MSVKNKINKNDKKSQRGRSMVEMLGVLAIIGVLSVGGVYGYGVAMKKHKANELLQRASMLATTISAEAMTNNGALPEKITDFGNSSYGTFSTSVTDALDGKGFSIKIENVDSGACTQLEKMAGGMVREATCDGTTATITYYKNLATTEAEGEKSPTGGSGEGDYTNKNECIGAGYQWCNGSCKSDCCEGVTCAENETCMYGQCMKESCLAPSCACNTFGLNSDECSKDQPYCILPGLYMDGTCSASPESYCIDDSGGFLSYCNEAAPYCDIDTRKCTATQPERIPCYDSSTCPPGQLCLNEHNGFFGICGIETETSRPYCLDSEDCPSQKPYCYLSSCIAEPRCDDDIPWCSERYGLTGYYCVVDSLDSNYWPKDAFCKPTMVGAKHFDLMVQCRGDAPYPNADGTCHADVEGHYCMPGPDYIMHKCPESVPYCHFDGTGCSTVAQGAVCFTNADCGSLTCVGAGDLQYGTCQ